MKLYIKRIFFVSVTILFLGTLTAQQRSQTTAALERTLTTASTDFVTIGCDQTLWEHVYHSARLHVIQKCIEVTGTIKHVKKEADGDDHIQLTVDEKFVPLLAPRNNTAQGQIPSD